MNSLCTSSDLAGELAEYLRELSSENICWGRADLAVSRVVETLGKTLPSHLIEAWMKAPLSAGFAKWLR